MVQQPRKIDDNFVIGVLSALAGEHKSTIEWAMLHAFSAPLYVPVPPKFDGDFLERARNAVDHLEGLMQDHPLRKRHDIALAKEGYDLLRQGTYPIIYVDEYGRVRR